jgi:hypothetical protein
MTDAKTNSTSTIAPRADPALSTEPQPSKPWSQRRGESAKAHAAAEHYFKMRDQRSLESVARTLKKAKSLIARWSAKYQWCDRANAYDAWLTQIDQNATKRLANQDSEKRAQRTRDRHERILGLTDAMLNKATAILNYPLVKAAKTTKADETGRPTEITVLKPARWTLNSAARLIEVAQGVGDKASRDLEASASSKIKEVDIFEDVPFEPGETEPK